MAIQRGGHGHETSRAPCLKNKLRAWWTEKTHTHTQRERAQIEFWVCVHLICSSNSTFINHGFRPTGWPAFMPFYLSPSSVFLCIWYPYISHYTLICSMLLLRCSLLLCYICVHLEGPPLVRYGIPFRTCSNSPELKYTFLPKKTRHEGLWMSSGGLYLDSQLQGILRMKQHIRN